MPEKRTVRGRNPIARACSQAKQKAIRDLIGGGRPPVTAAFNAIPVLGQMKESFQSLSIAYGSTFKRALSCSHILGKTCVLRFTILLRFPFCHSNLVKVGHKLTGNINLFQT